MKDHFKAAITTAAVIVGSLGIASASILAYERLTPAVSPQAVPDAPGTMHYVVVWWIQQDAEQPSEPNQYTGEQSKPVKKKVVCIRSKGFVSKAAADAFIAAAPADVKTHMQLPVEIPGGF